MIDNITIQWPPTIEFGTGKINTLTKHLETSKRVFVLSDPNIKGRVQSAAKELGKIGLSVEISTEVVPEPPFEILGKLLELVRAFSPDAIVGVGGGSTMDLAKLVSVLFAGKQTAEEILGIGNVKGRSTKLITVATTSGTGSEVTPIAILTDLQKKVKKGIVSPYLIPDVAIVDPELTLSSPPMVTASTGLDALTHCIEAYININAHPIIDNIALEGIRLIGANIETAVNDGDNIESRTGMALGSLYGGMCLGPVNTATVHAMAYPVGGEFKVPHGIANASLLPYVMSFNLPSCTQKFARIADALGVAHEGGMDSMARRAVLRVKELSERCGIPSNLKTLNIPESAIPSMAESAILVKRLMDNNPRPLTVADVTNIYRNAYQGKIDLG